MSPKQNVYKLIFVIIHLTFVISIKAQTVFFVGGTVKLSEGDTVFINGHLQTKNAYFDNGGWIYISDSLVNFTDTLFEASSYGKMDNEIKDKKTGKDSLKLAIGQVIFVDDTLSRIFAYKNILFNDVIFDNPAGLSLSEVDTIAVLGGLEFRQGVFNLNGYAVKMYFNRGTRLPRTSGVLINENNSSRVVDSIGTGSVVMVKNLINMGKDNFSSLGIEPIANLGTGTKIVRYHSSDAIKLRAERSEVPITKYIGISSLV